MENRKTFGARIGLVWFSLGIFLVFQNVQAKENKTDPTDNVNLSPNQGWRSSYFCLSKTAPAHCFPNKSKLTDQGLVDVPQAEVGDFCNAGCAKHAYDVLNCIRQVKSDFWFVNNASVAVLQNVIMDGCNNKTSGISTVGKPYEKSSGIKVSQKMYVPFFASAATLAFMAMSSM